jgi:hypothetical protein
MTAASPIVSTTTTNAVNQEMSQSKQKHNNNALNNTEQQQQNDTQTSALQYAMSEASELQLSKSLLSDAAILQHIQKGSIIIEPFTLQHLSTTSYDVTLGQYYYREHDPAPGESIYNPYSEKMVRHVWGDVREAELASEWVRRTNVELENICSLEEAKQQSDNNQNIQNATRIIWLKPGETILGHTQEFIGGKSTGLSLNFNNSKLITALFIIPLSQHHHINN